MLRFILLSLLLTFVLRAVLRLWAGFLQGMQGQQTTTASSRGGRPSHVSVQMARDPICGTFVVPDRALELANGSESVYFCSVDCRDKYRAQQARSRPASAHGRTA